MKRILPVILLFLPSLILFSQVQKDTINLFELEIISTSNPVEFKQVSRVVHIITKDQINNSPVVSMDDLLKVYGGVDIRSRGAMGVQSDINLRGGTFDQGLIMVDGISLNDPQTGHHNLNQAIDLDDIDRVEVFEGPGARWFGANSFSGGINIISSRPKSNSLTLSLAGGQYGYVEGKVGGSYIIGRLINKTSGGIRRSSGYTRNTDFSIISLNHTLHQAPQILPLDQYHQGRWLD